MFTFFYLDRLVIFLTSFCFLNTQPILFIGLFLISIILCAYKKTHPIVVFALIFISSLYYFVDVNLNFIKTKDLYSFTNQIFEISIRDEITNYVGSVHSKEVSNFLFLTLFGIKSSGIYGFYYQLIDLAVVHIIVISGFHLSALWKTTNFIFKKTKHLKNIISFLLLFFVSYLNTYSIGCLRSLLFFIIGYFVKDNFKKMNLSILFILIVFPQEILGFSFQMSYICVLVIFVIGKNKIQSNFFKNIFTSFFVTIFLIPFIAIMNGRISLWSIFYSWLLTPFFVGLYFFSLIFCWFNFSEPVLYFCINSIYDFCNILNSINIFIPINIFKSYLFSSFYLSLNYLLIFYVFEKKKLFSKHFLRF